MTMDAHENVPRYFADFLRDFGQFSEKNAQQHGELGREIEGVRTDVQREFKSQLRWMIGTAGAIGVAIIGSVVYASIYIADRLS